MAHVCSSYCCCVVWVVVYKSMFVCVLLLRAVNGSVIIINVEFVDSLSLTLLNYLKKRIQFMK